MNTTYAAAGTTPRRTAGTVARENETNELSEAMVSIALLRAKCWPPMAAAEVEALVGRIRDALA